MDSSASSDKIVSFRAPPNLRLSCWTARDKPLLALLTVLGFAGLGVGGAWLSASPTLGMLSFAALALSAWRLWIPVAYEIGSRGITQELFGRQRLIPWRDIGRCELRPDGVLLLPDPEATTSSVLRGLYIQCRANRHQLLDAIEYYVTSRATRHSGSSVVSRR